MDYCIHCMEPLEDGVQECPACGKSQDYDCPEHHLHPGTLLAGGRYQVGAALGEGGFGITYLARDTRLGMTVAVKEFYPMGYVSRNVSFSLTVSVSTRNREYFEKGRRNVLDEAHLLAELNDEPGIVDVRDFFEENNTAYIVMEYLRGETLKAYLARTGAIPFQSAYAMLRPVMDSLTAAHEKNVIHRDIAPDNIMLTKGGAKLLDFGAAREVFSADERSLSILVKRGFSPYEQYTKKNQGPWTDVYALCAVLYRAVTGDSPEDALERVAQPDKPLSFGAAAVPAQVQSVLNKGLAVHAAKRYQTVGALMRALDEAIVAPAKEKRTPHAKPISRPIPGPAAIPVPGPQISGAPISGTPVSGPSVSGAPISGTPVSGPLVSEQRPKMRSVRPSGPAAPVLPVPAPPQKEARAAAAAPKKEKPQGRTQVTQTVLGNVAEKQPPKKPDRQTKKTGPAVKAIAAIVAAAILIGALGFVIGRVKKQRSSAENAGVTANASISDSDAAAVQDDITDADDADGTDVAAAVEDAEPDDAADGGSQASGEAVSDETLTECRHENTRTVAEKKSTCEKKGYSAGVYCDDCGTWISGHEKLPLAAHTLKTVNKKNATCTQKGYTGDKVCSVCGKTIETGKEIAKTAHTPKTVSKKDPTCTSTGRSSYQVCSVCGTTLTSSHTIAALGHTDQNGNGKCDRCGTRLSGGNSSSGSGNSSSGSGGDGDGGYATGWGGDDGDGGYVTGWGGE